jgi:hypothetical protein
VTPLPSPRFAEELSEFRPLLWVGARGKTFVQLLAPLTYRYGDAPGATLTAPSGFISDGASIPRLLWVWPGHPLEGEFLRASVLHDWMYRTGEASRAQADRLFFEALQADGVSPVRARVMYAGVRVGGWLAWRRYRRAEGPR